MDKHFTYLLINIFTVLFPVLLSFDKKVQFAKKWRFLVPGLTFTGFFFLIWDHLFTVLDVWSFNSDYILGIYFFELPLEEILFFITIPFACIFIYECLNSYISSDILGRAKNHITRILFVLSLILLVFFFDRVYTLITFGLLLLLTTILLFFKPRYLGRFYLAYFVSLLPFYLVNGLLTSLPVVLYNNAENMAIRVGTIPFEDHFYSLAMLLVNILFFEHFKAKASPENG